MSYGIYIDINRCTGCQACVVACMDQNDLDVERGKDAYRHVYLVEAGNYPQVTNAYISLGCLHCTDAPCKMICPTGAIGTDHRGGVGVDTDRCIGCHLCLQSCPVGVPRYDTEGKMGKCDLCIERVRAGLEPACVRTCPTQALSFGRVNAVGNRLEARAAQQLVRATLIKKD